jgi:hypothetical protein
MRKYSKKDIIPLETLIAEVPNRAGVELSLKGDDGPAATEEAGISSAWAAGLKDLNPDNIIVAWERLLVCLWFDFALLARLNLHQKVSMDLI